MRGHSDNRGRNKRRKHKAGTAFRPLDEKSIVMATTFSEATRSVAAHIRETWVRSIV